ncbi:MAG: terminase small subunit [Cyanobacteria bacterium P01_F01_bin.13]
MPAPRNSDGLTAKQQKFCQEFFKDFNASAAYRRAGYKSKSPDVSSAELLRKPNILNYLNTRLNKAEEIAQVSLAAVVREAGRLAFSDITEAMSFDKNGVTFKDSKTLPKRVTASIRSVSSTRTITRDKHGGETEIVNMKMEFHGKSQAIAFLGKFFGVGQDFNQARAALLKYGIAMIADSSTPTGFRLELHDVNSPAIASIEATEAATEFTGEVWESAEQT